MLSGNLQNEYSWCYSPETALKIRINGQLFLLMLIERLIDIGCIILQANTDGLFVLRKKADEEKFQNACKEWEQITKLTLEEDKFERFYQYAINDYLAIAEHFSETKDPKFLKKKGLFIDEVTLGKGMAPMIIPKAINNYFAYGTPIKDTICGCKDLNDFITYQKVSKDFRIEYNGELITRINRYYVSTNSPYLYKCKVNNVDVEEPWCRFRYKKDGSIGECHIRDFAINGKHWHDDSVEYPFEYFTKIVPKNTRSNYINLLCDSGVTICNNLEEIKEFPKDINYNYYIKEANKIITKFENKQLSLF